MKMLIAALMATLLLLIFFPTAEDKDRDYSFYYQNSKVKQVSTIVNQFDLSDGKAEPNMTNKVWNEETEEYEDVPVSGSKGDNAGMKNPNYKEPANAYMPIIDPQQSYWVLYEPPGKGGARGYDGDKRGRWGYADFGGYGPHTGFDLHQFNVGGSGAGGVISAVKPGRVVKAVGETTGFGTHVVIVHPDNSETLYGHMIPGTLQVKKGDIVQAGQPLGIMGKSGNVSGTHLHFETRTNDKLNSLDVLTADPEALASHFYSGNGGYVIDCAYIKSIGNAAFRVNYKPTEMLETEVPGEVWKVWKERGANS